MMRYLGYASTFALIALAFPLQAQPSQPSAAAEAAPATAPAEAATPAENTAKVPEESAAPAAEGTTPPEDAAASPPAAPAPAAAAAAAAGGAAAAAAAPGKTARHNLTAEERNALTQGRQEVLRDKRFSEPGDDEPERRATDAEALARVTIGLSVDSVFYVDPGYDLFDDNNVAPRLGIWASYDLVHLTPRSVLAVELGAGTESQEETIWAGELNTALETQTLSAGVSVRYALTSWLDPQLRAAGGASFVSFELNDGASTTFEDDAISGFGSLGAGVLLHTPSRAFETKQGGFAAFQVGALIEAGYSLRAPVEFALKHESPELAIALTDASLGQLDLAGAYIRSSMLVRF